MTGPILLPLNPFKKRRKTFPLRIAPTEKGGKYFLVSFGSLKGVCILLMLKKKQQQQQLFHFPELQDLKVLLSEAEEKHFPESERLLSLASAVTEAEKCANVAHQLVSKKVRTR